MDRYRLIFTDKQQNFGIRYTKQLLHVLGYTIVEYDLSL